MKKSTILLLAGYALALVFGFIGVPKQKPGVYVVSFLLFSGLYWLAVYYIKKFNAK